ncbi:dihydroneopterin aldolase [Prevotella sp.]|uniref:dihydroneopterin aldolase n=1 Tax=Prevotella sp. TaxID=59823 RepID=UPI002F94037F
MIVDNAKITLTNLRFHAFHGVMPQERIVGNDYTVSVEIGYDFSRAMVSDNVRDTLNYAEVYEVIAAEMRCPGKLLEYVAGRMGQKLMEVFPAIREMTLQIVKLNPPMGADTDGAGVEVHLINDKTGSLTSVL